MNSVRCLAWILTISWFLGADPGSAIDIRPPGQRPLPPSRQALTGATVVVRPGEVLPGATILFADGRITAVGTNIVLPPGTMRHDRSGQTIYAGFCDPYLVISSSPKPASTSMIEPDSPRRELTSGATGFLGVPGSEVDPGTTGPGLTSRQFTPERRMAQEYAPDLKLLEEMRSLGFTTANVVPEAGIIRGRSVVVALAEDDPNRTILKADVHQSISFDPQNETKEGGAAYPRSLMGVIAAIRQTIFDAGHYQRDQEHYQLNKQRRPRALFNPALAALLPILGSNQPVIIEPGSVLMVDRAARLARELQFKFYLVASGQEWRRPELARAAGVPFIVPLHFPELPKLPEPDDWQQVTLDQFRVWDWAPENPALLQSNGVTIALTTFGLKERKEFRKKLQLSSARGLSDSNALAALTIVPAQLCGLEDEIGTIEPGKLANFTVVEGPNYFEPRNRVREVWIEGQIFPVQAKPDKAKNESTEKPPLEKPASAEPDEKNPDTAKLDKEGRRLRGQRIAKAPWDRPPLARPRAVLVQNTTLWTCGPAGRIEGADLLIVDAKVAAVGTNLTMPFEWESQSAVIDGRGKQVTPGLIDAHNHSMILGGVNESTLPSTAMVRISDVVNSESPHIHRQLAGGLTVANLLHGSANPIGGQNCLIKLREGETPEELKMRDAPAGIKFALGENVKQSNWGGNAKTRFPQTRMGVRTFMANRFAAARQYMQEKEHPAAHAPPLRRDLELEALSEIMRGQRDIHCHSYRQDEILTFLRVMEQFGVKVRTLQHVLEGYKIPYEIARHGAGASCFADWWAYKFEVYDAIPFAGSLMASRGVLVSFNSDSADLARRLNLEAAKAVKYGDTTEELALAFVTINPARQLQIDGKVGSLEVGKDGDFVLWSKSPLDSTTACLQTWIEGKKYFDRAAETARAKELHDEREALFRKAQQILAGAGPSQDDGSGDDAALFFKVSLEHRFDAHDRHCLDQE